MKTEQIQKNISLLKKALDKNKKENSRLYNKLQKNFEKLNINLQKEAEANGFIKGTKIRIKETSELPKNLRKRRDSMFWKWFDISGTRIIDFMYATNNTGRPSIDNEKPELIIHFNPMLERKDKGFGPIPVVRLSDIELVK